MTDTARWDDAKRLFHAALELETAERDAYLRTACAGSPELLAEVQSLLSWAEESDEFLETPMIRVADLPMPAPDVDLAIGTALGSWRIAGIIGRGGMGVVYRAERADAAFKRAAAIKVVRGGAHAHDISERFRRERETLAALDHPNIARVIDGGTTAEGQPYFVMEYVDGVPVDKFCDQQRLTIEARLALFETICHAVQYAHQTLVVHRDIKPDNILVTRDGVPKLLDFGIARLLTEETASPADEALAAATWLMTPDFASPEQMHGRAVTTATDVYSLGVLLHVLLTGSRPYKLTATTQAALREQLTAATLAQPSQRVLADDARPADVAVARATSPRRLSRQLAGDLDAIVLRALDRDTAVRYATVEQLLDDLDRHRTSHPVLARRRDVSYVGSRFVQRHAVGLTVAAGAVLLTAVGVGGVLWQATIAADAQSRAERRFEDVRRLAHVFMFDVHDEIVNVPGTTRARALMVRTASDYLSGLAREASGDASLQRELATAFVRVGDAQGHPTSANIGDTAGARASYERAIEIAGAVLAATPDDLESARTQAMAHRKLGDVLAWSGDLSGALREGERSGELFASLGARSGATAEDRLQAAIAEIKLGDVLGNSNFPNLGRTSEADERYTRAHALLTALASSSPADERVRRYQGLILERIGTMRELAAEWTAATEAYQGSFAIREALAATAPFHAELQRDLAVAYEKLGNAQLFAGNVDAAATSYRGALAQFDRLARADPSNAIAARSVAISREKLASTLQRLGQRDETVSLLRSALSAHQALASRDGDNAQARCDAARLSEMLGDVWSDGSRTTGSPGCGYWRDSLQARERLRAGGIACAAAEDVVRVSSKLSACR